MTESESDYGISVARGAGGRGAPPRATKKIFLGIFVGMRQKWAEFGEVHTCR